MRKASLIGSSALCALLLAGHAHAAPCTTADVSFTIGTTTYLPTSCADGLSQTGGPAAETGSLGTGLGTSLTYLGNSDDSSVVSGLGGVTFQVTANGGVSGSWNVTWIDVAGLPNLPLILDLGVGLFGGNAGSGYLFDDVLLPTSPTTGTGMFNITFTNKGGQNPDLSHLLLAGADPRAPDAPPHTNIPEPASWGLVGTAMVAIGLFRRKRRTHPAS